MPTYADEAGKTEPAGVSRPANEPTRHVLMIVSDFPPSIEMGAQTCWQIARNLPGHGWTPVVLTKGKRPGNYRDLVPAGLEAGVTVVRTGVLRHPVELLRRLKADRRGDGEARPTQQAIASSGRRGWLRRMVLAGLNVPDTETGWILPAVAAGRGLVRSADVACLFSSGPAWSSHLAALGLARLSGLPWVAHFRDPWSQGTIYSGVHRWADRANARLERAVVERAAAVVCVTDRHTDLLRRHYTSCGPEKFVTVPNGYDNAEWELAEQEAAADRANAPAGRFVITHAGALYAGRSPLPVLEALRRLSQTGDLALDRVRFDIIVNDSVRQLPDGRDIMDVAREMGLDGSVQVLGPLPRRETLRRLVDSDLLLLLGHNFTVQVPGKLYEYLRSRRPILALVPAGAQTDLLRATGGAWMVEPGDVNGAVEAVRDAYRRWQAGQPGPETDAGLVSGFDRRVLIGRLAAELDAAVSRIAGLRGRR
jgi:glycosyltransferase involved in cell wall biosynthesis